MKQHTCITSTSDPGKLSKSIESAHTTLQKYLLEHIKGEVALSLGQIEFVIKKLRENVDNLEKFAYEAYESLSADEKYKLTEKDYNLTCAAASTREWLESSNATPMSRYDEFLKERARREEESQERKKVEKEKLVGSIAIADDGHAYRVRKAYVHKPEYYIKRGLPVPSEAQA